jgi:outer membrane protein assembly factor BamA
VLALVSTSARAEDDAEPASADEGVPLDAVPLLELGARDLPASLLGRPVVRVEVVDARTGAAIAHRAERVRPGVPLDDALARSLLRELGDTGRYAELAVLAVAEGEGVVLRAEVVVRRIVVRIDLEGGVLERGATLRAGGLQQGVELTAESEAAIAHGIAAHYAEHGFPAAKVDVRTVSLDDPLEALVVVHVEPGAPRLVSQRIFVIDPRFDRHVGELKHGYAMQTGDRLDESALVEADRTLTSTLLDAGFWDARVRHATRHVGSHGFLYVYVDPGPVRVLSFEGNLAFDDDQLREAVSTGGSKALTIEDLRARLERHYVDRGFLDVEIATSTELVEDGVAMHVRFDVRENERVRVEKRTWLCLAPGQDADAPGDELDALLAELLPDEPTFGNPDPRAIAPGLGATGGLRAAPLRLEPESVYAPEAYAKALEQLRDLYLSQGYLHAEIGPIGVVRARCAPSSPAGRCIPEPISAPAALCAVGPENLPIPEPPFRPELECRPSTERGIRCAPSVTLRIPLHLGPRTALYDVRFDGAENVGERELAQAAALELGKPLSLIAVEEAKARLAEAYQDRGYAYVEVRSAIEPSGDRTRARVRFTIQERDRVYVDDVEVEGAVRTDRDLILSRMALRRGDPYSKRDVRLSEERIATLGTFSSVSVSLVDPEVPQKRKRLLVRVAEYPSQYIDPRVGFSTGEGLRFGFEYGHRNIGGRAIALTLRLQLSYLFDFMILDSGVAENLGPLPAIDRLERRNSLRVAFPQIGLGPLVSFYVEGIDLRDNQRDFGLQREAFVPTITYRPLREVVATLSASLEYNDVLIFKAGGIDEVVRNNRALERLLRFPDGTTFAVAQRFGLSWDRRDNAFAATRGTYLSADVEHVNAFPADEGDPTTAPLVSHFLKLGARFAGYVRLTKGGVSLALSLAGGGNLQLESGSRTYPDRAFFLGGFDSMRAFLVDALVPEDVARQILDPAPGTPEDERLRIEDVAVRGGDLAVNPRAELRVPMTETFALGVFLDVGNLWVDPAAFDPLAMRWGAGAGVRIATPIGPLAFDYGLNLDRRPWEDVGALHFSIGLF